MKTLNYIKIMFASLLMIIFAGCQEENNPAPIQDTNLTDIMSTLENFDEELTYNIYESRENSNSRNWRRGLTIAAQVIKRPTFFTLSVALKDAGLFQTVVKNKLTVLAPTDDAFFALGITPENVGSIPNLREILLYHVLEGKVRARDLEEGYVTSLNGASIRVSLENGVFFNESEVIRADKRALNGIVHVIDQVLLPTSLLDLVNGNENFSILKTAIETAGLESALSNPAAGLTVFAPTNDAFVSLLEELNLTAAQLLANPDLTTILLYHVFNGEVFSTDLSNGLNVDMLAGGSITFDLTGAPSIIDGAGRTIPLNTGLLDIRATNGVVHVIDRVLLP
ncbi:fasciclin domain-containing protein [Fulvivirga sedimenti]|uniref:Fasciclin domain-containing protein n=1 Tax=Fulvivirga sedimenti TaxID=2879465 RepID=A0A9X1KV66_9BACT|nr:fasciclin domain-containing protein [Fulvivirga sedimenti]MCA6073460.1 fasciclin domain-containing protein [Fulvivirga sedimenti]